MKTTFKFTGTNLAAALLLITYFFMTWISAFSIKFTGFDITSNAISPGQYGNTITGISRLALMSLALVPLASGVILFQNVTNDKRFSKYIRIAHLAPVVAILIFIVTYYFTLKSAQDQYSQTMGSLGSFMPKVSMPALTDILSMGAYIALAAALALALYGTGKLKDKEYYTPQQAPASTTYNTQNPE